MDLRDYQLEGIKFLVEASRGNKGVLLHDEPGLGKSRQVIEALKRFPTHPVVVICPATLRTNWLNEFKKWGYIPETLEIVSFNFCQRFIPTHIDGAILVVDEAHGLKNWKAKQTQNIVKNIAPKATRVWALTGTPVSCLADIHPILTMCQPNKIEGFERFASRYSQKVGIFIRGKKITRYIGSNNVEELKERTKTYCFGRKKSVVAKDLPEKGFYDVMLDVKNTKSSISEEEIFEALASGKISEELMCLRRVQGIEKAPASVDFILQFKEPVIVFAHHQKCIELLESGLKKEDKKVCKIVGGMNDKEKQKTVDNFQNGEYDVCLCSIEASGVGITLARASVAIFVEFCWNYSSYIQACDRIHRLGQKNKVQIYNLIASDLDRIVLKTILSKGKVLEEFTS